MIKIEQIAWHDMDRSIWMDFVNRCEHNIQYQPEWLDAYCKYYADDVQPSVLLFKDGAQVVGLQPIQVKSKQENRLFKRRHLVPLGSGPTDFYSFLYKDSHVTECAQALVQWLKSKKSSWEVFELFELPHDSVVWRIVVEELEKAGFEVNVNTKRGYYQASTTGNWDEYFETFIKPSNKDLLKDLRKLERSEVELKVEQHKVGVYQKLLDVLDIYAQRRKALNQTNPYEQPGLMEFLNEVITKFEASGNVELSFLKDQRENIWSFQLDWLKDGTRYHWNHAYNEDFKKFSPGKILLYMLLRQAFEDPSILACNHMRGLTGYKSKLADQKVMTVGIEVRNHRSARNKVGKILRAVKA